MISVAGTGSALHAAVLGFAYFALVLGLGSFFALIVYARLEWVLEKLPKGRRLRAMKSDVVHEYRKSA